MYLLFLYVIIMLILFLTYKIRIKYNQQWMMGNHPCIKQQQWDFSQEKLLNIYFLKSISMSPYIKPLSKKQKKGCEGILVNPYGGYFNKVVIIS